MWNLEKTQARKKNNKIEPTAGSPCKALCCVFFVVVVPTRGVGLASFFGARGFVHDVTDVQLQASDPETEEETALRLRRLQKAQRC